MRCVFPWQRPYGMTKVVKLLDENLKEELAAAKKITAAGGPVMKTERRRARYAEEAQDRERKVFGDEEQRRRSESCSSSSDRIAQEGESRPHEQQGARTIAGDIGNKNLEENGEGISLT